MGRNTQKTVKRFHKAYMREILHRGPRTQNTSYP